MFDKKNILITGGTGSFGKEFVKTILKDFSPNKIIIYSRDEQKHFDMAKEFQDSCMRYFVGDVRDYKRLKKAMRGVDFVIHAAAMKDNVISRKNPIECINTNIMGFKNVMEVAVDLNIKKVIVLSMQVDKTVTDLCSNTHIVNEKLCILLNELEETNFSIIKIPSIYDNEILNKNELAKFSIKAFKRMYGGEIFIPKINNINKFISLNDSNCMEYEDYYLIYPETLKLIDYSVNAIGERGWDIQQRVECILDEDEVLINE